MRIWLVTVGEPLPLSDQANRLWRTGNLARTLAIQGHEVTWWTSRVDHFSKTRVTADDGLRVEPGMEIRFLEGRLYHKNISIARLVNHRQIADDFLLKARLRPVPDAMVVSLPPLELPLAVVRFGEDRGVPVLIDVRDLWPDEFYAVLPPMLRRIGPVLFRPQLKRARRALSAARGIVATSEGYLKWALEHAGRKKGRFDLYIPHGYPDPQDVVIDKRTWDRAGLRLNRSGVDPDRTIFWFVGTFVGNIDLATVISAARAIDGHHPSAQFVLSGSGERRAEWEELAQGLSNVVFTGWIESAEILWLAKHAFAGLAAYSSGALMSLPNKIFEYMSLGLPIVSCLEGEARALIDETECGLFYEPGVDLSLVDALRYLLERPGVADRMGRNARSTYESRFKAENIYRRYAAHIEGLVGIGSS